jgi:hypothetical protein
MSNIKPPEIGSQWVAGRALGSKNPFIWTVRGVTDKGVYYTCPDSRSPGHLLSVAEFRREFVRVSPSPRVPGAWPTQSPTAYGAPEIRPQTEAEREALRSTT